MLQRPSFQAVRIATAAGPRKPNPGVQFCRRLQTSFGKESVAFSPADGQSNTQICRGTRLVYRLCLSIYLFVSLSFCHSVFLSFCFCPTHYFFLLNSISLFSSPPFLFFPPHSRLPIYLSSHSQPSCSGTMKGETTTTQKRIHSGYKNSGLSDFPPKHAWNNV